MQWVTRDFVHLDRVATPWLIKRFVDRDARFVFVPWGEEDKRPPGAIPFALPGCELGPHDEKGTTFDKVVAKYELGGDPSIVAVADVIRAGVDIVLHGHRPGADDEHGRLAWGLLAISEGMMLTQRVDATVIDATLPVYDALYANFRAHHLLAASGKSLPPPDRLGPTTRTRFLFQLLDNARR